MVRKTRKHKYIKTRKHKGKLRTRKYKKHGKRLKSRKSRKGGTPRRSTREPRKTTDQINQEQSALRQKAIDDAKRIKAAAKAEKAKALEAQQRQTIKKSDNKGRRRNRIFIERARRMARSRLGITPERVAEVENLSRIYRSEHNPNNIYDIIRILVNNQQYAYPSDINDIQILNYVKTQLGLHPIWTDEVHKEGFDEYIAFLISLYKETRTFPENPDSEETAQEALQEFEFDNFFEQYPDIHTYSSADVEEALLENE